jgi:hypothetical protein
MNKKDKIRALKTIEPTVLNVTLSEMGYEFEAATPEGFIYSTPEMLLNSHQRQLPPEFTDEDQSNESIKALLLQDEWDVVDWKDVDSITIDDVYKLIFDFTKMHLYEKVNQSLSREQIHGLTKVQLKRNKKWYCA